MHACVCLELTLIFNGVEMKRLSSFFYALTKDCSAFIHVLSNHDFTLKHFFAEQRLG